MWSRLVKTDSTSSKSHFGWETTHCGQMALKFDYIFQGPFGAISCSRNLLFPCARWWIPPSPFKTSMLWRGPAKPTMIIIFGYGTEDSRQISPIKERQQFVERSHIFFLKEDPAFCVYSAMSSNMFGAWWAFIATCHSQTHPPSMSQWLSTLRHSAQAPRCSHQELCINGVPSGVSCLIVKTLPFAECTVSDYTFLSQACSEEGKAHTAIAFVPHHFSAGTRNGRKWWLVRQQAGLGNIFRPWRGHIYSRKATKIDTDERNFHCWAPNGAPKGTYASQKKVLKEILLCIDWQKYSNIFQEDTQNIKIWFEFFFQMSVSGERDNWKEPSKYLETWQVTWKDNMPSRAEGFFLKSRPLGKKESRKDKLAKSKRAKIGSFIRWFICQLSLSSVNLLAAALRFLIQFWSEIDEPAQLPSEWQYTISSQLL